MSPSGPFDDDENSKYSNVGVYTVPWDHAAIAAAVASILPPEKPREPIEIILSAVITEQKKRIAELEQELALLRENYGAI